MVRPELIVHSNFPIQILCSCLPYYSNGFQLETEAFIGGV